MTGPTRHEAKRKRKYDIFVSGGSKHVPWLKANLPRLCPFGRVHLTSSFMTDEELECLAEHYDLLHQPRYHSDGYQNHKLFCALDIHRLAAAPYFIKLDADIRIQDDWIEYVDGILDEHPEAVLFGPRRGRRTIDAVITGPFVRKKLGADIEVRKCLKVVGGFYVGLTEFFQRHDLFIRKLLEFLYCFRGGKRIRPSLSPEEWPPHEERGEGLFLPKLIPPGFPEVVSEDTLRSLTVHALRAAKRLLVVDSHGRVLLANPGYRGSAVLSSSSVKRGDTVS